MNKTKIDCRGYKDNGIVEEHGIEKPVSFKRNWNWIEIKVLLLRALFEIFFVKSFHSLIRLFTHEKGSLLNRINTIL